MLTEFQFTFPMQDARVKGKQVHFTDLHVIAYAGLSLDGGITEMKIKKIVFFDKGESYGSNVCGLIQILKPELFDRICRATENNAMKILSTKNSTVTT